MIKVEKKYIELRIAQTLWCMVIFFTISIVGCKNNSQISEHFKNSDAELLKDLTQYYKTKVCKGEFSKECLNKHLRSVRELYVSNKSIDLKINGNQLERIIGNHIKGDTNSIFIENCRIKNWEKEISVQFYCLNPQSNLKNYLKSLNSKDDLFVEFANSLESLGDISIIVTDQIIRNYEDYEFYKSNNLLILILHHCSLEIEWNAIEKLKKLEQDTIANNR